MEKQTLPVPADATQAAFLASLQSETLALFSKLRAMGTPIAIQSSACGIHCLSGNSDFYNLTVVRAPGPPAGCRAPEP